MSDTTKALEALDRIFNYCEEIDLHLPKEEQVGYDMLVDINIIREALGKQTSDIEELEKIRAEIEDIRDWVGGTKRYFSETELNEIFNRHIAELKGE